MNGYRNSGTYIYTIEYYSAIKKKECIWVSLNEVDGPRACFTEWSKLERERQILCINTSYGIQKDSTDEPFFRAAIEMQT